MNKQEKIFKFNCTRNYIFFKKLLDRCCIYHIKHNSRKYFKKNFNELRNLIMNEYEKFKQIEKLEYKLKNYCSIVEINHEKNNITITRII